MIERTESEAAGFVCPFKPSLNAAGDVGQADHCIGSRCMLWVPVKDDGEAINVTSMQLAAHFKAPAYDPLADRDERIKALVKEIREAATRFANTEMPGRTVLRVQPAGEPSRPSATVVLASASQTGHCGVVR